MKKESKFFILFACLICCFLGSLFFLVWSHERELIRLSKELDEYRIATAEEMVLLESEVEFFIEGKWK